ncbi:MAG: hypothetical protein ABJN62_12645 [Halioglobus sp.]
MKLLFAVLVFMVVVSGLGWLYLESDPARPTPSSAVEVPSYLGAPAIAKPVLNKSQRVQHPFLAPAGLNSMHNDAAQSDSYPWAGPLGVDPKISTLQFHRVLGSCVAQTFNSAGQMIGTCVTPFGVTLVARDPDTLEILARQVITRWLPIGEKFSGGVYFHLDSQDRVLLATNDLAIQLWELTRTEDRYQWSLQQSIPLDGVLNAARGGPHRIIDVMPDWQGNYWFITRAGVVGVVSADGEEGEAMSLGIGSAAEGIDNALAVGEKGVFVVSSHAMYSFRRGNDGELMTQWREEYDRGSAAKEGTMGYGSGTTPTLVGQDYVAITDNADGQVNMMIYDQGDGSVICKHGIFPPDKGTTENSLAAVGRSLIAENNFGYSGPKNVPTSEPGLARVDILADGGGCVTAWENLEITSPSAVPKVSEANGLIYLYTRDPANPADLHAWYFTAVDFETGEPVFKLLTGTGWLFNNHYGSISISPDGAAYVGIMGGLVRVKDSDKPR